MFNINKMATAKKLVVGFGVVLVLLLITGAVAFTSLQKASSGMSRYRQIALNTRAMEEMLQDFLWQRIHALYYLDYEEDQYLKNFEDANTKLHESLDLALSNIKNPERHAKLEGVAGQLGEYEKAWDRIVDLIRIDTPESRREKEEITLTKIVPLSKTLYDDAVELLNEYKAEQDIIGPQVVAANQKAIMVVAVAVAISLLFGIFMAMKIKKDVVKTEKDIQEKVFWFESILDSVPYPISVTDNDMNWTFLNKAVENITGLKRDKVIGEHCSKWGADICNTERCGIASLKAGRMTSYFKQPGVNADFQVDTQFIKDRHGAQIGHIEIIQNITATNNVKQYNEIEVDRLAKNLERLASGQIEFDMSVSEGTEYTTKERENFVLINKNLSKVKEAVGEMIDDAALLTEAAKDGRLETRADADKHKGNFRMIVEGINQTLDAVIFPINEAMEVLKKAAMKDLTARVKGEYKGQLDEFKNDINLAIENLDGALNQVAVSVEQVNSASTQIASGSQQLAEGANEQASSLEEISASLEEMSSMTKNTADNSKQANQLSLGARNAATNGDQAMQKMSQAINKIKESSDSTAKIIKTIDEIAFQTNLLALNAAVEAARAGEAGKGFAVVAEEVRNLAQRSAEAAKNTAELIEGAQVNADQGVSISEEVARFLTEIVDGASKVNDLIKEIDAATDEQSKGIEQVNRAVSEMNKLTQQNASNSEESASAAEELNSQSAELTHMVETFKVTKKGSIRRAA